jgi:hypothetical protein
MTRGYRVAHLNRARADTLRRQDHAAHNRLAALASILAMACAMALLGSLAAEADVSAGPAPASAGLINF